MSSLVLDRMAIEDGSLNPQRLAEAVHAQLPADPIKVPVYDIARALDIDDIREEHLSNVEAALVTTPERDRGQILLNLNSDARRRRFSLAHELLHFLNATHIQTDVGGFSCTRNDMRASGQSTDRHRQQESEANTFAIELLAPRSKMRLYLSGVPDLAKALTAGQSLDISREAAARRYIQLHPDPLAIVFCKNQRVTYWDTSREFPTLALQRNQQCHLGRQLSEGLSDFDEIRTEDWLTAKFRSYELSAQTLWQREGHTMTLLHATQPDDDDPGFDDAYDRLANR